MSDIDMRAELDATDESYKQYEAENLIRGCSGAGSHLLTFGVGGGVYIAASAGKKTVGITISRDDANRLAQQLIREATAQ